MATLASVLLPATLAACASSSVLVGKARPAIQPEQVKLYLRPPKKYEEVALLDASSKQSISFTDQGRVNVVIERLKAEAAKLGANGVLLSGVSNYNAGSVGAATATSSNTAVGVSGNITAKSGSGIAIFVEEE